MFCCTLLHVHSSFAIILMGKRELVAVLSLSSWCLVMVVWLSLAMPWVCLQFVIVVFPDHSHLLFLRSKGHWLEVHCHVLQRGEPFTVLQAKSDSDVMFCLHSYQGVIIDISFVC